MRNGNFLKMCVSEIHVKQIRANQGLSVVSSISPCISEINALTPKRDTCYTNKSLKRFVSRSEEVEHRLLPPFNAAWYDTLQIIHTYLQVNRTKFWFWWSGGKIYIKRRRLYISMSGRWGIYHALNSPCCHPRDSSH